MSNTWNNSQDCAVMFCLRLLFSVDAEFNERLDEVSEYYKDKGVCEGKDCHRLLLQVTPTLHP